MRTMFLFLSILVLFPCNELGAQEILDAASRGDLKEIKRMLSADPAQIGAKTEKSETVVHMAAFGGYLDTVRFAHEKGVALDSPTDANESPLHYACYA